VAAQNRPDVNDATSGSQTPTLFQGGNFNFTDLMQLTNQLQNPRPDGFNGGSSIDAAVKEFRLHREPIRIRTVSADDEVNDEGAAEAEPTADEPISDELLSN
jgi:hypothetical protein